MQTKIEHGNTIKDSVHKLADQGSETMHVIKDRTTEMADQVKQQSTAVLHRSLDFIRARPIASLGIALAAGYMSRTLFRIGMIASVGLLVSRLVPKISGVKQNQTGDAGLSPSSGLGL